jgi:integrase
MANIRFYLHRYKPLTSGNPTAKNADQKEYVIYFRYRLGREIDFRAPIAPFGQSMKVTPNDWNHEKEEVKGRAHLHHIAPAINGRIADLKSIFTDFEADNLKKQFRPNYEDVKIFYKGLETISDTKPEKAQANGLFDYIEQYIKTAKEAINPHTGSVVTHGTIKSYERTKNVLRGFHNAVHAIDFETVNMKFYRRFVDYCQKKGMGTNYIGQHIKTLKTFMNNAVEDGATKCTGHKAKGFVVIKEEVDAIYLNLDELEMIRQLDLSSMPNHERARDLFLLGAFTGLRVSDFNQLNERNIHKDVEGNTLITVKTQKTGEKVSIPASNEVLEILRKNNGQPPRRMPEQHINRHIKEVGQMAGIDGHIFTTSTKGGTKRTENKLKFELIKTHTARRSFCTNAYLSGIPAISIMKISGHRTEKAFLTYIKVSPEENASHMAKHAFFNRPLTLKAV